MLSRAELERIATTVSRGNVGQAETLYLQDILLSTVSRETVDELVFKGETALLKLYQLDRFSEDLDFTGQTPLDFHDVVAKMERDLTNYGAMVDERTIEETTTGFNARFGIQGPLYDDTRRSLCFLRVEVNTETTAIQVRSQRYTPQFPDIPSFDLATLTEAELLAEKIRAIVTRTQPRDLYDIYHLLEKSVELEPDLIAEKLGYYNLEYDPQVVISGARNLESGWHTLEPLVYSRLPPFDEAFGRLERELASSTNDK